MWPPEIFPPMSEQELLNFNRCKGNDQGLMALSLILIVQTILSLVVLPTAGAVGKSFSHLMKLERMFKKAVKVVQPAEHHGDSICTICLEPLSSNASNPEDPGVLWSLPCSHVFHMQCVLPWLAKRKESSASCPTCRACSEVSI